MLEQSGDVSQATSTSHVARRNAVVDRKRLLVRNFPRQMPLQRLAAQERENVPESCSLATTASVRHWSFSSSKSRRPRWGRSMAAQTGEGCRGMFLGSCSGGCGCGKDFGRIDAPRPRAVERPMMHVGRWTVDDAAPDAATSATAFQKRLPDRAGSTARPRDVMGSTFVRVCSPRRRNAHCHVQASNKLPVSGLGKLVVGLESGDLHWCQQASTAASHAAPHTIHCGGVRYFGSNVRGNSGPHLPSMIACSNGACKEGRSIKLRLCRVSAASSDMRAALRGHWCVARKARKAAEGTGVGSVPQYHRTSMAAQLTV